MAVSAGDTVRWVIGDTFSGAGASKRVHILVKPFAPSLKTNLVITTDRRTYHLALESTKATAMAALSWTYPADALMALKARNAKAEATAASTVDTGLSLDHLRFRYAISGGSPAWKPLRAFDDGTKVYIEFPARLASSARMAGRNWSTIASAATGTWSTGCSLPPSCGSAPIPSRWCASPAPTASRPPMRIPSLREARHDRPPRRPAQDGS